MKKIILLFMLLFMNGKVFAEQYFLISGLSITQTTSNQIKANLKVNVVGSLVYNSYTIETNGNLITLKVCYDHYLFDGGDESDNDFYIDIPSTPGNYTLKVAVYSSGSEGCNYQTPYMQDTVSLDFANPFSGTIFLSTTNPDYKANGIKIFPNPVKETLNFSEEVSNIKITDLSGRMVKQISASAKSVNVSALRKGVYIISATTKSGETVSRKMVKE